MVSTDCPSGPDEILDGGRLGRLVPVGDAQAMADAIQDALTGKRAGVPVAWLDQFRAWVVVDRYLTVLGLPG